MVAYCDVRLAKEGAIGLRPRYLRGLDGGAICAAANVALGTLLLISSQAVAVPMEETLAFGADDWIQRGWYRCTRSRRARVSTRRPPP